MDEIKPPFIPGDDLSKARTVSGGPWYRRWWVYTIVGLLVFWFGTPFLLGTIISKYAPTESALPKPSGSFTAGSDVGATPPGLVDVVTTDDPTIGSPAAPVVIVEFADFQCPFCRNSSPVLKQVLAKYPEAVRLIYRDFPLIDDHDQAVAAAEAANCAYAQGKFWEYHDRLYEEQANLGEELYQSLAREFGLDLATFNRCREGHLQLADIQADYEAGLAAGVGGTPTWFVNGYKLQGDIPAKDWDKVVVEVLKLTLNKPKP